MSKLFALLVFLPGICAYAAAPTHHCQVYAVIQRYESMTMKYIESFEAKTDWFDVTEAAHEDPKELPMKSDRGVVGQARVWTGTLLATPEGDVLQAHSTVTLEGARGEANLILSLDSRLGKSSIVLAQESEPEFLLIPVDLKCERI